MPKESTRNIQDYLVELGNKIGFLAEPEKEVLENFKCSHLYCPRYDVVWSLNLSQFKLENFIKKYIKDEGWSRLLRKVPVATFEIEGSNTSSKNQIGNFANLYLSPSMYSFVIVNNEGAKKENDTYRRGIKIHRTVNKFWGNNIISFADWSQIRNISIYHNSDKDREITVPIGNSSNRSGFGGEKKSIVIYDKVIKDFEAVGMCIKQNYTPSIFNTYYTKFEMLRSIPCDPRHEILLGQKYVYEPSSGEERKLTNISSYYYMPKIDFVLGFNLPKSFLIFLKKLAIGVGRDVVNNDLLNYASNNKIKELFFPYLGCEIESETSKHMNGGIMNCSKFCYSGLLISPDKGKSHLKTLKRYLGITNVFHYGIEQ